jgi:nucleotide-binding universal stress UspA family protein
LICIKHQSLQRATNEFISCEELELMSIMRVLAATDGSPGADRAVDAAAELATACGAELLLVNVGPSDLDKDLELLRRAENACVGDILESVSQEVLTKARERPTCRDVRKIRTCSRCGDAVRCILDVATKEKADVIVVGKRGYSRLEGLLIGSVSQKLASLAPCKVMIVP